MATGDNENTGGFYDIPVGQEEAESGKAAQAVALKYERKKNPAPVIVAKGKGYVAEQILALAFANDVKVREDAALVDILGALDVDSPIPLEAYAAVAEILSYVYRANQTMKQNRADYS